MVGGHGLQETTECPNLVSWPPAPRQRPRGRPRCAVPAGNHTHCVTESLSLQEFRGASSLGLIVLSSYLPALFWIWISFAMKSQPSSPCTTSASSLVMNLLFRPAASASTPLAFLSAAPGCPLRLARFSNSRILKSPFASLGEHPLR